MTRLLLLAPLVPLLVAGRAAAADKKEIDQQIKALKAEIHALRDQENGAVHRAVAGFRALLAQMERSKHELERQREHLRAEEKAEAERIEAHYRDLCKRLDRPEDRLEALRNHLREEERSKLEGASDEKARERIRDEYKGRIHDLSSRVRALEEERSKIPERRHAAIEAVRARFHARIEALDREIKAKELQIRELPARERAEVRQVHAQWGAEVRAREQQVRELEKAAKKK